MSASDMPPGRELIQSLDRVLAEECDALSKLVDDEDADCISRDLRAERLGAYEHVRRILRTAERWEW